MANTTSPLLPQTEALLREFGGRLRLARLRRRLQAKQVAERAGMTEVTLRRVEHGMPGVTIGAYLAVMQVVQLQNDIEKWAADDPLGRQLQDADTHGGMRPRRFRRAVSKVEPANVTLTGGNARMAVTRAKPVKSTSTQAICAVESKGPASNLGASVSANDLLKVLTGSTLMKDADKNKK